MTVLLEPIGRSTQVALEVPPRTPRGHLQDLTFATREREGDRKEKLSLSRRVQFVGTYYTGQKENHGLHG